MSTYYYRLHVSKYSDFSELAINKIVVAVTEAEFADLENNTLYYWRVKRVDNLTGAESIWSDVCTFRTVGANVIIDRTTSNVHIEYVVGSNSISTHCDIPDGQLGSCLCISGTYPGKLGTSDCLCNCQQNW